MYFNFRSNQSVLRITTTDCYYIKRTHIIRFAWSRHDRKPYCPWWFIFSTVVSAPQTTPHTHPKSILLASVKCCCPNGLDWNKETYPWFSWNAKERVNIRSDHVTNAGKWRARPYVPCVCACVRAENNEWKSQSPIEFVRGSTHKHPSKEIHLAF